MEKSIRKGACTQGQVEEVIQHLEGNLKADNPTLTAPGTSASKYERFRFFWHRRHSGAYPETRLTGGWPGR